MKGNPKEDPRIKGMVDAWRSVQTLTSHVFRWLEAAKEAAVRGHGSFRRQNLLAHNSGIQVATGIVLAHVCSLEENEELDRGIVHACAALHDQGEAEADGDSHYGKQNDAKKLREYMAFRKRFEQLDEVAWDYMHQAFLLQHVTRPNFDIFPEDTQRVLRAMRERYHDESLVFECIEMVDYYLYAFEHIDRHKNPAFLEDVVHNTFDRCEDLANEVGGFREAFWTDELRDWLSEFRSNCDRVVPLSPVTELRLPNK